MGWLWGILAAGAVAALWAALLREARRHRAALAAGDRLRTSVAELGAQASRAEAVLDAVMDHARDGVLVLDDEMVILAANAAARRLLDFAGDDQATQRLGDAVVGGDLVPLIRRAQAAGSILTEQIRRMGPGGGAVAVTVAAVPTVGMLVVAHDVTDAKRLEALRRDFVANVSHELRTPMASIRAMAETLREGAIGDPEVSDRFLDTILKEADRLTRISDDLLTLSDAETKPPELRTVSLTELCGRIRKRLLPQANQAGISIALETEPDVRVLADEDRIEQVLVNLVDNAIKYTPAGGHVAIRLARVGDSVEMSVSDTGIGILQEHLPRIFERFYRADKARSRQSGGTGLGLSIVKNIVESHGGSVSVRSEYTRGSTFTVSLPCGPPERL